MQRSFRGHSREFNLCQISRSPHLSPWHCPVCFLSSLIPGCAAAPLAQDVPLRDFSSLRQGMFRLRTNLKSPLPWVTALITKQQHWRNKSSITSVKGNLAVMLYTEKNTVLMWCIFKSIAHIVISGCIMVDFSFHQAGIHFHRKEKYTEISLEVLRELASQVEACHLQE